MKALLRSAITILFALAVLAPYPAFAQDAEKLPIQRAIHLRLEVWKVPQLDAIEFLDEARGMADSLELTHDLRKRAKSGDAHVSLLALPSITSKSGQRAKVDSGTNSYISGYKPDTKTGMEVPVKDTYLTGTSFEVDAVIGVDIVTIDINLAFEHALSEPTLTDRTIVGPVSGKNLVVQSVTENRANITTAATLISGQTRLLGSIPAQEDDVLLVFLSAEVIEITP